MVAVEKGKTIQVEAVQFDNGCIERIHGKAPNGVIDSASFIRQIRKYLEAIIKLSENDEIEPEVIVDLAGHAAEFPMRLCEEALRGIRTSFPEEERVRKQTKDGGEQAQEG